MTIDKSALKALADAALPYSTTWPCQEDLKNIFDWPPADLMAAATPAAVLALLAEIDQLAGARPDAPPRPPDGEGLPRYGLRWNGPTSPITVPMPDGYWTPWHLADQLRAENESLKRDRTDWQAECLKKGFEYVREPDAHYVLADVPEMAALLGQVLGVEVRSKDNDDYGETVSSLNEQLEACNSVYGRAYDLEKEVESLRKDAERNNRMLVSAAITIGEICEALGIDNHSEPDMIVEAVRDLKGRSQ